MLKPFPFRLAEFLIAAAFAIAVIVSWRADLRDRAQLAADLAAANQSLAQASARQRDRDAQLAQTLSDLAAAKRAITTPAQILRDLPNRLPLPSPITLGPEIVGAQHAAPQLAQASPDGQDSTQPHSSECTGRGPSRAPFAPPSRTPDPATNSVAPPCSSGTQFVPEGLDSTAQSPKTISTQSDATSGGAQPSAATALLPVADLKPLYDFTLDCQACQSKLAAAQSDLTDERAKTATLTRERDEAIRAAKGGSTFRRMARAAKWFALGAAAGAIAATAHH